MLILKFGEGEGGGWARPNMGLERALPNIGRTGSSVERVGEDGGEERGCCQRDVEAVS